MVVVEDLLAPVVRSARQIKATQLPEIGEIDVPNSYAQAALSVSFQQENPTKGLPPSEARLISYL